VVELRKNAGSPVTIRLRKRRMLEVMPPSRGSRACQRIGKGDNESQASSLLPNEPVENLERKGRGRICVSPTGIVHD